MNFGWRNKQVFVKSRPSLPLIIGILVLASSVTIMSTDMYSPSLPDMVGYFDTTPTLVKLTISLNLLAFGIAQLFHGPLSDRFGRRPVMLWSLATVVVLSLICAAAQSIEQLLAARILLGIAAAAEAVLGLAILKDLYDEQEQVRALALLGMVIAVAPAVGPILGGYLHVAFGWQSNFIVIAGLSAATCAVVWRYLPESTTPDLQALQPTRVLRRYLTLINNSDFLLHSLMCGVALGLILVFITAAPFVLIERLDVATQHFGYYQAAIVIAFFFGSLLASRLADRWPGELLMHLGLGCIVTGATLLMGVILIDTLTPLTLVATYSVMTFGMGPLFAVAPSRALRSIDGQAGTASAMLSGLEQCVAGTAALAISVLHDGTAMPMVWTTASLAVALLVLVSLARRQRPFPSVR